MNIGIDDIDLYISKNCFIAMSLKVINVNVPRIMFLWRLDQSQIMHLSLVFSDTYYVMFTMNGKHIILHAVMDRTINHNEKIM